MRTLVIVVSVLALAAAVAWQSTPLSGHAAGDPNPPLVDGPTIFDQPGPRFAAGQLVVRFRDGASENAISKLNAAHGARTVDAQPLSGLHRLVFPAGANLDPILAAYQQSPLVEEAGLSLIAYALEAPNDTNYSFQWHLHDTIGGMWAESAWDLSTNRGQGVVVAVIDTGVAYEDHNQLLGGVFPQNFKQAPDLAQTTFVAPWDFYSNDPHANDDNGHGSHVAGSITQDTGNAYGVAGVASNSSIMPLKVLTFDGTGPDAGVVEAIYHAVNNGADVISMSLGFPGTGSPDGNGDVCTEIVGLNAALDFADASGVVIVAAAGNSGSSPVICPAAHPSVIAVGATRFDGQIAPYSNSGALSLTAPGGDPNVDQNGDGFSDGVVQESYCFDWVSLILVGNYDAFCDIFLSGTSMATPQVSGTAALLLGEDPTLTPDQVRVYLETTARDRGDSGWDPTYGWGVLDAYAALAALMGISVTPTPTATPTATPSPTATSTPTPTPTVEPPGPDLADLVQAAVSGPPGSKKAGGSFRVTDTVENQGAALAAASWTRFYLSTDPLWDPGDTPLSGSRAVPDLAPGATSSGKTRVAIPEETAPAIYYLIVCADDTGLVPEGDETNNCLASSTTIEVTAGGGGGGGGGGNGGGPPPGRGPNR